jgi:hypothetical protein
MVREFNSGNSTQKRRTTSGTRTTRQSVQRVRPVAPVKKAGSTAHRTVRKPVKKKGGFIANLLRSDRTPGDMDYTFLLE